MSCGFLTFPFAHSKPLWQDHLPVLGLVSASQHLNRQSPQPALSVSPPAVIYLPSVPAHKGGYMPISSLQCTFLRTLFAELHAHAFEHFAAAAFDRAADLSMWVWQLMAPSVSNSHTRSHSNKYNVKSGPQRILGSHRAQISDYSITHIAVNRAYSLAVNSSKCVKAQLGNSLGSDHT